MQTTLEVSWPVFYRLTDSSVDLDKVDKQKDGRCVGGLPAHLFRIRPFRLLFSCQSLAKSQRWISKLPSSMLLPSHSHALRNLSISLRIRLTSALLPWHRRRPSKQERIIIVPVDEFTTSLYLKTPCNTREMVVSYCFASRARCSRLTTVCDGSGYSTASRALSLVSPCRGGSQSSRQRPWNFARRHRERSVHHAVVTYAVPCQRASSTSQRELRGLNVRSILASWSPLTAPSSVAARPTSAASSPEWRSAQAHGEL